jgi:hypothetical protein
MTVPVAAAAARTLGVRAAGGAAARRGAGRAPGVSKLGQKAGAAAVGMPAPGTEARKQRDAIDAIKAQRAPEPEPETAAAAAPSSSSGGRGMPDALTDNRGAPGWWRAPDPVRAANSGGGFVLGLVLHALAIQYLREGAPGVRRYLRAKLFNVTGPA